MITLFHRRRGVLEVAFLLALLLSLGSAVAADSLKVVTWNLEWFPGGSPEATAEEKRVQMSRAQDALRQINPDIFLCQEVASWKAVEELTSVVPGLTVTVVSDFGAAAEGSPPQNVGISSKLPVDSGWAERWKDVAGRTRYPLPRGFAFAAIELPEKAILLTYTVHFKSNYRGKNDSGVSDDIAMREESSQILRAHISRMREIYGKSYARVAVLIGGDFNTALIDPRFAEEKSLRAFREEGFSWGLEDQPYEQQFLPVAPTYQGKAKALFDHFFAFGLGKIQAKTLYFRGVRDISDHMPVAVWIPIK